MEESQVLSVLAALAQETRLRILRELVKAGDAGLAAGHIGAALGASSSRLSFHLAALERAGVIRSERVSRQIIYRVDFSAMGALLKYLLKDCCGNHPAVAACCAPQGRA